jgi:S1-C subfamily serine protease
MFLKALPPAERAELDIPSDRLALKVEHVGQFSPHDIAKKAGVQKGDMLISYAGRNDLLRESDLLAYGLNGVKPGESVELLLLRDGQKKSVAIRTTR